MRFVALLCSLFVLLPPATHAKMSKADCKAHAAAVSELAKQFGMRPGIKGRALLDAVESWVASHDEPTIRKAIVDVERTTKGIEECNDAGRRRADEKNWDDTLAGSLWKRRPVLGPRFRGEQL